jgi:4-hydroxybenzoate polyprenyltransferase/phosphoserine phosphatase
MAADMQDRIPLVVDCDRTLTPADMAVESMVRVARRGPRAFLMLLWWLLTGRAGVKARLARHDPIDAACLPIRPEVATLIAEVRTAGRPVILASAGHRRNLSRVARVHGPFDAIIGTNRRHNAKGAGKLAAIRAMIGDAPFDYIGDAAADRPIWAAARTAYTVGVGTGTAHEVRLSRPRPLWRALLKAMRPHQWAKNALVFVPVLTAGLIGDWMADARALIAFALLSLLASSVYLVNDTLDIDADRAHKTKYKRPIASGDLPVPHAILAALVFAGGSMAAAWFLLGPAAFMALGVYLALTVAYSFYLKATMIADVIALACLYTIRLVIGAAAVMVPVSGWLLLFSMFFFLSLAYLKRYIELRDANGPDHALLGGRGYVPADGDIVAISGIAAGMVSLLVIALFAEAMAADSEAAEGGWASGRVLWLLVLPLLYWLNRVWLMARRGQVDGDPVAFAIRDPKSIGVGAVVLAIVAVAKFVPLGL